METSSAPRAQDVRPRSARRTFDGHAVPPLTLPMPMTMRPSARLLSVAALALAAGAPPRSAAAQMEVRGVVFAVSRGEDGEGVLEPVTVLVRDGFDMPVHEHSDSAMQAFDARWLNAGRTYPVLWRGERAGTVVVRTPDAPACMGLTARGALDLLATPREGWQALAGAGLPEQAGAPWLRAPNAGEKRELDRMAAALLDAHGIDVAGRTQADTAAATLIVHENARPVLVASYRLRTEGGLFRQAALLVVAEEGQNGYRPAYTWFHEAVVDDVESRRLVDAADLDGDGVPELVIRNGYYESWDFGILKRTELGWRLVYRGGRGGC